MVLVLLSMVLDEVEQLHLVLVLVLAGQRLVLVGVEHLVLVLLVVEAEHLVLALLDWELGWVDWVVRLATQLAVQVVVQLVHVELVFVAVGSLGSLSSHVVAILEV